MKKNIVVFVVSFIILSLGVLYWGIQDSKKKEGKKSKVEGIQEVGKSDIILFYGDGCPHCGDVEDFLEKNKVTEKVDFENLEIWYDKKNTEIFLERAKECGYAEENLGVPFLYARGKCFVGAPEIESFFKKEIGL